MHLRSSGRIMLSSRKEEKDEYLWVFCELLSWCAWVFLVFARFKPSFAACWGADVANDHAFVQFWVYDPYCGRIFIGTKKRNMDCIAFFLLFKGVWTPTGHFIAVSLSFKRVLKEIRDCNGVCLSLKWVLKVIRDCIAVSLSLKGVWTPTRGCIAVRIHFGSIRYQLINFKVSRRPWNFYVLCLSSCA